MQLSPHFKKSEFACKCCGNIACSLELLDVLEDVRAHFNAPVTITSGYRCASHNRDVGGEPKSQHLKGNAADIKVKGVLPRKVANYFALRYPDKYGIGRYPAFTHIDVRPVRARWGSNA